MNEALRIADALEQQFPLGTAQNFLDGEAAAELRRLHALNAELVEALNSFATNTCCDRCQEAALVARAVLTKVEASNGS